MPAGWSRKDERMYEHVKESYQKRGKDLETAKEIAARTVNERRDEERRTKERQERRDKA